MFKKILLFDFLIAVILGLLIQILFKGYVFYFLLGLIVAALGFTASGLAIENTLKTKLSKGTTIIGFISFFKVIVTCIIGIIIFNNNINNVIAYILGFISHFFGLILYGLFCLNNERK